MKFFLAYFLGLLMASPELLATLSVPTSLTHERKALPKEHYEGVIPLMNKGEESLLIKITLVDYRYNANGESYFDEPATHSRSNAPWVSLSHNTLEIPPQNTVNIRYSVAVPANTDLLGTYWSMLLVEPVSSQAALPSEECSVGLQTIVRYGIQLITQIGETGDYNLKILNKQLFSEEGKIFSSLEVENSGSRLIDPFLKMDVFDTQGKFVAHFTGNKLRILPNCSVKYAIDLSSLTPGCYKAMVILDGEDKGVFGAEYDLNFF